MVNITINSFLTSFPEFLSSDPQRINSFIEETKCTACFDTFVDECVTEFAMKLHVAHLLSMYDQATFSNKFAQGGQRVKKLKTKHDEIEFQADSGDDPYGWTKTQYGQRLQDLILRHSIGFTMSLC